MNAIFHCFKNEKKLFLESRIVKTRLWKSLKPVNMFDIIKEN